MRLKIKYVMLKKGLLILLFFLLGLGLIYYPDLSKKLFKTKVYIVYDIKKDSTNIIDWGKFGSLLQDDFDPTKIIDDIYQGPPLDGISLKRLDSIKDLYHKSPRKFINRHGNQIEFGVQISPMEKYIFDYDRLKPISNENIDKLKELPIDSIITLLDEKSYDDKFQFYIVVPNFKNNDKIFIARANPIGVIY